MIVNDIGCENIKENSNKSSNLKSGNMNDIYCRLSLKWGPLASSVKAQTWEQKSLLVARFQASVGTKIFR